MKIALMSGAFVNAGDFLIEKRCVEVLKENVQGAEISILKRNMGYNAWLDEFNNNYDLIVFGGGPGFQRNLYPERMPFLTDMARLKTPLCNYGVGMEREKANP